MKITFTYIALALLLSLVACSTNTDNGLVDEDRLGFIDADVKSRDTELKMKAPINDNKPGSGKLIDRAYENAPPLIPHTTAGFLPIKRDNNICMGCHLPDKVGDSGATPISETHFLTLRPQPKLVDGKYELPPADVVHNVEIGRMNNLYFNCSQCHVSQTNVTVDIENLFTPDFRKEFNLHRSGLKGQISEGVK